MIVWIVEVDIAARVGGDAGDETEAGVEGGLTIAGEGGVGSGKCGDYTLRERDRIRKDGEQKSADVPRPQARRHLISIILRHGGPSLRLANAQAEGLRHLTKACPAWILNKVVNSQRKLSAIFGALADPTRRRILVRLSISGEDQVTALAKPFSSLSSRYFKASFACSRRPG